MSEKQWLDIAGLTKAMNRIDSRLATEQKSIFKTDTTWEAASLAVLQSWVTGGTATDPINNRTVNNFDVYAITGAEPQYYFDSGTWFTFTVDLTNYYTKDQADARYASFADFPDINLSANTVVIPSKFASQREIIESILTASLFGIITAVQTTTVTVQFKVGSNIGNATLPFDGVIGMAKVGGLIRIERLWDRTIQSEAATVTYTLNTTTSRCYSQNSQQADWNVTDSSDPAYIKNKPTIPAGVEIIDSFESSRTDASLAANRGRLLKAELERLEQEVGEPISDEALNAMFVATGFPPI